MHGSRSRAADHDSQAPDRTLKIRDFNVRAGDANTRLQGIHIDVEDSSVVTPRSRARMTARDFGGSERTMKGSVRAFEATGSRSLATRCALGVNDSRLKPSDRTVPVGGSDFWPPRLR
jgi:hypothetical protein